jgi:hypothetical protein
VKRIGFVGGSVLVGDEVAETALRYAAELAHHGDLDDVELRAIDSDGERVDVILLLGAGSPLRAEVDHSRVPEPDNTTALNYMRRKIRLLRHVPAAESLEPGGVGVADLYQADLSDS